MDRGNDSVQAKTLNADMQARTSCLRGQSSTPELPAHKVGDFHLRCVWQGLQSTPANQAVLVVLLESLPPVSVFLPMQSLSLDQPRYLLRRRRIRIGETAHHLAVIHDAVQDSAVEEGRRTQRKPLCGDCCNVQARPLDSRLRPRTSHAARPREAATQPIREERLVLLGNCEDALLESHELLVFVWNSRRQGCDVPVHVSVALIAPERQKIDPLGTDLKPHRLRHAVHGLLETDVLVLSEVACNLLEVCSGRHQSVPVHAGVCVEEGDGNFVLVHHVMWEARITGQDTADEARSSLRAPVVGFPVRFVPLVHVSPHDGRS